MASSRYPFALTALVAVVAVVAVLLVGCEAARPPLTRSQAIGAADSMLLREYIDWGSAVEVFTPDGADADDRDWWQVRYPDGPNGESRVILVDESSRWAKFAPKEYVVRVAATGAVRTVAEHTVPKGTWILMIEGDRYRPVDRKAQAAVDASELNLLATRTGLQPLFSVREIRSGEVAVVWGWDHQQGTIRDEAVRDWLHARTVYQSSTWVNLGQ